MYDSAQEAEVGHAKWVAAMTAKELPDKLRDVGTAWIAVLRDVLAPNEDESDANWRTFERISA